MFVGEYRGIGYVDPSIERRPTERIVSDAFLICRATRPDVVNFETNGFQEEVAKNFEKAKMNAGMLARPVLYTDNRQNREYRIALVLGQLLQRGLLRFRRTPGCNRLVQQVREFPLSEHDDGPDGLERALTHFIGFRPSGECDLPVREDVIAQRIAHLPSAAGLAPSV